MEGHFEAEYFSLSEVLTKARIDVVFFRFYDKTVLAQIFFFFVLACNCFVNFVRFDI